MSRDAVQYLRDSGPFGGVNKAEHMLVLLNYNFLLWEGRTKAAQAQAHMCTHVHTRVLEDTS